MASENKPFAEGKSAQRLPQLLLLTNSDTSCRKEMSYAASEEGETDCTHHSSYFSIYFRYIRENDLVSVGILLTGLP